MLDTGKTQRQIVLDAMKNRPDSPWPRGEGHVPLGEPGWPLDQKAYHEPGGSFSPSPGSFGVSFWIEDSTGRRVATSDDIPLGDIQQKYVWSEGDVAPAIATRTPLYQCTWSLEAGRLWRCRLKPAKDIQGRLVVLIRSVGPAGGPVDAVDYDGGRIIVNHRWVVSFEVSDAKVSIGDEEVSRGLAGSAETTSLTSIGGWAFARIDTTGKGEFILVIRDTTPTFATQLTGFTQAKSAIEFDLPDKRFSDSIDAQAANLMMGFVGAQTRPGEPVNYPLTWERDGAYAVLAMARCGQVAVAKELAKYFAENEFFGGFGAEGDAAGSTLNAIVSVAAISGDKEFAKWLWPHVQRKVAFIEKMLSSDGIIRRSWLGPIVPQHRQREDIPIVCKEAKDGLIYGMMDLHFPVLYINAISFMGLRQASRLAGVLGKKTEAKKIAALAGRIQKAWLANFGNKELANERTYMSSLWPTRIIGPDFQPFVDGLQTRWLGENDQGRYPQTPLWTYFTAAEAHQWLFLDRPDNVWKTMNYFWLNQCSPGLYTYWEGEGEENAFGLWENIRGWVAPRHVTPHYWTAAEMLLLQLDMLTYVDDSQDRPTLVIGAGVPKNWLKRRIGVKGMPTSVGIVDWSCSSGKVDVTIHGKKTCDVRFGDNFDKSVKVKVKSGK